MVVIWESNCAPCWIVCPRPRPRLARREPAAGPPPRTPPRPRAGRDMGDGKGEMEEIPDNSLPWRLGYSGKQRK